MPLAVISVSDKSGLVEFSKSLSQLGWEFLASRGTASHLRKAGLAVQEIAEYTGSPEILGGRVKSLHPAIHAGILARSTTEDQKQLQHISAQQIDMVVVNLYPFQKTIDAPKVSVEAAVENIDIGGVAMMRAAAKNYQRVTVLCDPNDYETILDELSLLGETKMETRHHLARKAFLLTAEYDWAIANYFGGSGPNMKGRFTLDLYPQSELRYGENPHQAAALYSFEPVAGPLGGDLLQGKPLSYNNLLDLDAAWRAVVSFDRPTVCIVKHLSPCGIASAHTIAEAFPLALACDPVSAFGGIVAANRLFDEEISHELGDLFVEAVIAPDFTTGACEVFAGKPNLRVLSMSDGELGPSYELRSVNRGILLQDIDRGDPDETGWQVVTKTNPTPNEWKSLRFAWQACQHVKSNAIVFVQGEATVGIGGGQPNRVDCVRIAAQRAAERSKGAVMASDAFFPFPDAVWVAAKVGIRAIIAPGGSLRDKQVIAAADEAGISMVFTGRRHFRH
jgi:phosphoribosylaminoimidazolecarboxamide formyltransferase/IMP cyclohydrolase